MHDFGTTLASVSQADDATHRCVAARILAAAVRAEGHSLRKAAARLGVSKSYLYKKLDGHPEIRRGADLTKEEVGAALETSGGQVDAAAARLGVSVRALQLQLKRLGLKKG